ncbi:MAG: hypothetical protein HRU41_20320 [Saprospiraceae bacterium]|nr:hypothetical protein [Saprospiraceae bacterium]
MSATPSFIDQARRMLQLTRFLKEAGIKNKEIAHALDMYPSAFSALINNVLSELVQNGQQGPLTEQEIKAVFHQVNNVSELKTRRRIQEYLQKLETLKLQLFEVREHKPLKYIDNLINGSPGEILRLLEGVYHCYYISSFGYRVKREPFLIYYDARQQTYRVRKGNKKSPAWYEGFGYMSNNHLFTIQIAEKNTLAIDNFMAHFHLPPLYAETMEMLKGISISMSNSNLPIARKMLLHRVGNFSSLDDFNQLETVFFKKEEGNENEIVRYLREQVSFIEYLPIPYPDYAPQDLVKENKVKELI